MLAKRWAAATVAVIVVCGCGVRESETTSVQEWDFTMEKVWELQKAGDDGLLRPAEPRIADDGTLYLHDFERHISYIFDGDGKLVGTFAPQGSGEGEVPFYLNCFPAGDYVAICAPDKLHIFTEHGEFVKAVPNNLFVRFPLAFKNENALWVAPGALGDAPSDTALVTYVDLVSGDETIIHEFPLSDDEGKPSGGAVIVGMTPQAKMGIDRQSNRIYFGKNSDTVIYWRAVDGSTAGSFSFTGVRRPVSGAEKIGLFTRHGIPEEQAAAMAEALPDQMAYYNRITVVDGLVFLLSAEHIGDTLTGQTVDVFSADGQHLYYGRIQVEDGWHISNPDNLQLGRGVVFAVQENDAGDRKIVKYRVALPVS